MIDTKNAGYQSFAPANMFTSRRIINFSIKNFKLFTKSNIKIVNVRRIEKIETNTPL